MSSQFGYYQQDTDEDTSTRCVLDVVCIEDPNERKNRFQVIQKEYEAILVQAENLMKEKASDVKDVLSLFTKITRRIKDSREKLKNLKTRLRVCKNTFSTSFEKAENISRAYLITKESVKLMRKISFTVDSSRTITEAVNNKNYLQAALVIHRVNYCLNNDLTQFDALINVRLDMENHISKLYASIVHELMAVLFNYSFPMQGPRLQVLFQKFYKFPDAQKSVHDSWRRQPDENIQELVETLRILRKLRCGLLLIVKSFDGQLIKMLEDVVTRTHTLILENMALSKTQAHVAKYDKNAFFVLLSNVFQHIDCVHQKSVILVKCFDLNFENYDGDADELNAEESSKINSKMLEETIHNSIQINMKLLLKSYLDFDHFTEFSQINDQVTISPRALHQVFSLRQRLAATYSRGTLYKFESNKSVRSEFVTKYGLKFLLQESCMANVCTPSVKYFKNAYLPLQNFVYIIGNYYFDNGLVDPLKQFIVSYFCDHYYPYMSMRVKNFVDFNFSGHVDTYRLSQGQKCGTKPTFKLFNDCKRSHTYILKHLQYFPDHSHDFIVEFCQVFHAVKRVLSSTFDQITVNDDVTLVSCQVYNTIPSSLKEKLYCFYEEKELNVKNCELMNFLANLEEMLASSLLTIRILCSHIMTNHNFEILLDILDGWRFMPGAIQELVDTINSLSFTSDETGQETPGVWFQTYIKNITGAQFEKATKQLEGLLEDTEGVFNKYFAIVYFEIRFHIIYHLQSLFRTEKASYDIVDPNMHLLLEYLQYTKEILRKKLCIKAYNFIFLSVHTFICEYILVMAKTDFIKDRIPYIQRCLGVLHIEELFNTQDNVPNQLLDHLTMSFDQIINDIYVSGPKFSYSIYAKLLTILKDTSLTVDSFDLKMKDLQKYINQHS
ncbi:hypothetical protein RF11_04870 [Thelohanellus kitauei]|uniref:Exocyst complex component Sec8 n=1 Tax=Thelohanellus kitauei TaxID=669202 RepID=A0A0C2MPR3_THEKT|nr:hypothetical protein RF11_04870 [Thelohanellus kitauei]